MKTAITVHEIWFQQVWRSLTPTFWNNAMSLLVVDVTATLGGVWTYQAFARLWRPRADWRDWLGRWLGGLWVCSFGASVLFLVLWG